MWCSSRYRVSAAPTFRSQECASIPVPLPDGARDVGGDVARACACRPWRLRPRRCCALLLFDLQDQRVHGAVEDHGGIAVRNLATKQVLKVTHLLVGLLRDRELVPIALRRQRRHQRWCGGRRRRASGGRRAAGLPAGSNPRRAVVVRWCAQGSLGGGRRRRQLADRRRHVRLGLKTRDDQLALLPATVLRFAPERTSVVLRASRTGRRTFTVRHVQEAGGQVVEDHREPAHRAGRRRRGCTPRRGSRCSVSQHHL